MISERIPPLPKYTRERLIDRYCPAQLAATTKANPADQDCMVRVYFGRKRYGQRTSRFQAFTSRNYPLHVDQMEELALDTSKFAEYLADALATMH